MVLQKIVNRKKNQGQAMTEYVIIICLVAVAALLVVGVFGTNIRRLLATADTSFSKGVAQSVQIDTSGNEEMSTSVGINKFGEN